MCLFGTGVEVRGMFKVKAGPKGGGVGLCLRGCCCCWTTRVAISKLEEACDGYIEAVLPYLIAHRLLCSSD